MIFPVLDLKYIYTQAASLFLCVSVTHTLRTGAVSTEEVAGPALTHYVLHSAAWGSIDSETRCWKTRIVKKHPNLHLLAIKEPPSLKQFKSQFSQYTKRMYTRASFTDCH